MFYLLLAIAAIIGMIAAYLRLQTCLFGHTPEMMEGTPYVKCVKCPQTMNWMTGRMTWQ